MQPTTFLEQLKQGFMPILASEHGKDVDYFILIIHWLMAALFVGWMAYFCYALFRFRKSANPKADYVGAKGTLANNAEIAVVIVEAILLIAFAIPLWAKAVEKFPKESDATVMRLVAEQFSWQARYPGKDGVFGKQELKFVSDKNPLGYVEKDSAASDDRLSPPKDIHVPLIPVKVDGRDSFKPVIVHLTTKDVIHCFKVTAMRMTQDCMPGMSIPVHFTPTRVGKFNITCAQLCGNGHASMNALFVVDSPEDFDKWLAERTTSAAGGAASFE
ncbi:MAG: cytochrome c oxidase subunit II [Verrucomicrobia bacterium]|nr:cytochrome c oxidase subunit II [Verrucomicrobiota bacterium]